MNLAARVTRPSASTWPTGGVWSSVAVGSAAAKPRPSSPAAPRSPWFRPTISDSLPELVAAGRVRWQSSEYDAAVLAGFVLVVAATPNQALNLRIAADAEGRGILCCNVSASRSQVIFPALYTEEEVTVAVHSDGRKCGLSKRVATKSPPGCETGERGDVKRVVSSLSSLLYFMYVCRIVASVRSASLA